MSKPGLFYKLSMNNEYIKKNVFLQRNPSQSLPKRTIIDEKKITTVVHFQDQN